MFNDPFLSGPNEPGHQFAKRFEQYLLKMANVFIDQADNKTQAGIIKLIYSVDTESNTTPSAKKSIGPGTEKRERISNIERLIAMYQNKIDSTLLPIARIENLLKRTVHTPSSSALINHYLALRTSYIAYLSKIQALQQNELSRLERKLV